MLSHLTVVIFVVDTVVGLVIKAGFPAVQQVHFPNCRLNGSGVDLKTAGLQLFLDVLILAGTLARTVDLLGRKDQYADGRQQVFLLLSIGSCL